MARGGNRRLVFKPPIMKTTCHERRNNGFHHARASSAASPLSAIARSAASSAVNWSTRADMWSTKVRSIASSAACFASRSAKSAASFSVRASAAGEMGLERFNMSFKRFYQLLDWYPIGGRPLTNSKQARRRLTGQRHRGRLSRKRHPGAAHGRLAILLEATDRRA